MFAISSPHPLGQTVHLISSPSSKFLTPSTQDTYNGLHGQILGSHHDSTGLIDCLRPEVKGFDYPTLGEHFSTEQ
jgi:hypothetical protein